MQQLLTSRLTASATSEEIVRELTNLVAVTQVQQITTEPTASTVPAVAIELADDDARSVVEIVLAPTAWRITDALVDRPGRWVRVAPA